LKAVHTLRHQHNVKTLCRVLGVNRSTYYGYVNRKPSARTLENQQLRTAILEIYGKSRKRFGAHKIRQRILVEYGIKISVGRVYRLMKEMQLPKMSTVKPKYVKSFAEDVDCPNLLQKKFAPTAPNQVWVSDITYKRVSGNWRYICAIIDLFGRKLIAYSFASRPTAELAINTFSAAYYSRGMPKGLLFHTDRGSQYTAKKFRQLLDKLDIIQSFSAKAHPYDNAVIESFFKYLKQEELDRKSFNSDAELSLSLFEYENFYNHQRPHSFNDGLTPCEAEDKFYLIE